VTNHLLRTGDELEEQEKWGVARETDSNKSLMVVTDSQVN